MSQSFGEFCGSYFTPTFGVFLIVAVGVLIGLLALFVLHSLTIWASADPEVAFHRARQWVGFASSGWNSVRTLYNSGMKIAFYWLPYWNHFAKHAIEPGIYIGLDVISQVFVGYAAYSNLRGRPISSCGVYDNPRFHV